MKHLQRLLALIIISAGIFSCQKEYSIENHGGNSNTTAQWEFKEGGVQFKGPIDTVAVDTLGGYKFLTINGRSDDGSTQFTLQAFGADLKVGTYKTPFTLFAYIKGATPVYQTDQTAKDSFTVVITKVDSTSITGTFNGKALSGTASKTIVDGKFTAILKSTPVTPPPSTDSGQVVLWSKAGCGGLSTNPISVTVAGKSGTITSFTTTEPTTCTPAGAYSIKLPVGTYPWVAKCGTDSVKGTVTVTKDGCIKQIVDFTAPVVTGDYFPLTKNSNWTYLYQNGSPSDTAYTFMTGTTATAFGNTYYLQVNDYGGGTKDSAYYRKSGNSYFQYIAPASFSDTSGGNKITITTPAYDYKFFVDNMTAGSSFSQSVTGSITSNGLTVPIVFTFKTTILQIGASVTVSGVPYTNVIKSKSLTSQTIAGNTTDLETVENWYAPNIGLIKFLDYYSDPTFTTPDDVWNLTRYKVF